MRLPLIFAIAFLLISLNACSNNNSELEALNIKVQELESSIEEKEASINTLSAEIQELQSSAEAKDAQISDLQTQIDELSVETTLLQVCPEEWIDNQFPRLVDDEGNIVDDGPQLPSEYYILNGERREISEFDADWVENNCDILPMVVQ